MEATPFQFDFYYWLFTFKFELELYRLLARVGQTFRRYPWVRPCEKWGRHSNDQSTRSYAFSMSSFKIKFGSTNLLSKSKTNSCAKRILSTILRPGTNPICHGEMSFRRSQLILNRQNFRHYRRTYITKANGLKLPPVGCTLHFCDEHEQRV